MKGSGFSREKKLGVRAKQKKAGTGKYHLSDGGRTRTLSITTVDYRLVARPTVEAMMPLTRSAVARISDATAPTVRACLGLDSANR